jgi:hypothetical protein
MCLTGYHSDGQVHSKWWTFPKKAARFVDKSSTPKEKLMTVRQKTCTKCKQTKPSAQFKRRLSLAQTRAVLKNPNITTNYMADSKLCKACQPKRKPPRKLTAKEIRTRITNKDMHYVTGELLLEKKREGVNQGRSRVMREYWQGKKAEPLNLLKKNLQDQLKRIRNRHYASKNLQKVTQEQNRWNYMEAKRIMKDLLEQARSGREISPETQIASLIKPQPKEKQNG